jgi:hypothetical protein
VTDVSYPSSRLKPSNRTVEARPGRTPPLSTLASAGQRRVWQRVPVAPHTKTPSLNGASPRRGVARCAVCVGKRNRRRAHGRAEQYVRVRTHLPRRRSRATRLNQKSERREITRSPRAGSTSLCPRARHPASSVRTRGGDGRNLEGAAPAGMGT